MELGGSDAVLILKDVDLDRAIDISLRSRLMNTG